MRRLTLLVGAIVLVDTMFYAAVTPLLPRLADELGLGKNAAGLLTAAYPAGTLLGALPAGYVAVHLGVRKTVLAGLGLMSAAGLAFAFGDVIELLDAARFVQGVGSACTWAGAMAWLASSTPRARRGEVLGGALGAAIFGVQLGPVIGALATAVGQEIAFSLTAVFGLGLAVAALRVSPPAGGAETLATPATALREPAIRAGMWLTALPAAAFGVLDTLAPLRLDALGASGLGIGATFFVAAGLEALISPVIGRITDRRGTRALVRTAPWAGAAALIALQAPDATLPLAALVVVAAGVLGVLWVPAMGLLAGGADRIGLDQGFAFAFFNLAWAGGFTVGAAAGGGLAEATRDLVPYLVVAGAYVVTGLLTLRLRGPANSGAAIGRG